MDIMIRHLTHNPQLTGLARLIPNVVYSQMHGEDLQMDLIVPWTAERPGFQKRYPLIVFIQGSTWTSPDRGYEIPQLSWFARQEYVVATVCHRNIFDGHPFPAFLEDIKCAIRFLRKNADAYAIDPDRIAVWGTSSGGNAAMLAGLTGNTPSLTTEEYSEYPDTVQAVVSCFGPTDIKDIVWQARHTSAFEPFILAAIGNNENEWAAAMDQYSPLKLAQPKTPYPPFFLLHGNSDLEVSYFQMLNFYKRLAECGTEVSAVCVDNAGHEWDFWSDSVYQEIFLFLEKHLKNKTE